MDLSDEKVLGFIDPCADPRITDCAESVFDGLKSCTDCRTTRTPLWRSGPSGPKSLCNACGIRYRKKRRAVMGLKDRKVAGGTKERRSDSKSDGSNKKKSSSLKMKMLSFGREVIWNQGSFMRNHKQKRMGEEEEAAVLLMAISSGFVYA
ncbi:hypothetical protein HPP92_011080 [Vanilla planifolia]|uniref:GATA-type domain-containing protein n=1 Tax=Vanilla planifolia TaxID=51239 RepID=A0A835V4P2_VANPL|nr:hypothetical protein HPP92_011080 [Vanilla planifolia]